MHSEIDPKQETDSVPLNPNSLVSFPFFWYIVSYILFLFIHGDLWKKFSLLHPLSFPLQCILFRSSFTLFLFINSVQICFTTFYPERQTKINTTSISNIFVPCATLHWGSLSIEDRHSNKFRLATLHVYHALLNKVKLPWQNYQYLLGVSSNGLYEFKHLGRGGRGINSVWGKIRVRMAETI